MRIKSLNKDLARAVEQLFDCSSDEVSTRMTVITDEYVQTSEAFTKKKLPGKSEIMIEEITE